MTLNKVGNVSEGVALMEKALPQILCPVLAAEILMHYYLVRNKEKAMFYYQTLEVIDGEMEMDLYSEKITTEEIKRFLGLENQAEET